jgi:hypothetical protein
MVLFDHIAYGFPKVGEGTVKPGDGRILALIHGSRFVNGTLHR